MTPIDKSNISTIASDIKAALRDGKQHVYDIIQTIANALNACVNYINTTSATLQANENERIASENDRIINENTRGETLKGCFKRIFVDHDQATAVLHCVKNNNTEDKVNLPTATTAKDGLLSNTDKAKLDGIESGAQKNLTILQIKTGIGKADILSDGLMPMEMFNVIMRSHDYLIRNSGITFELGPNGSKRLSFATDSDEKLTITRLDSVTGSCDMMITDLTDGTDQSVTVPRSGLTFESYDGDSSIKHYEFHNESSTVSTYKVKLKLSKFAIDGEVD